jgi:alcohol dehydrogenase class IV
VDLLRFEFSTSSQIIFGPGAVAETPALAHSLGNRVFVVHDQIRAAPIIENLKSSGLACLPFPVQGEPTIQSVLKALNAARDWKCDVVIGMGGGSTLDTGKALCMLLSNPGNLLDYLEIIGSGKQIEKPSFPFVAIPTTAGTGSEVTRNAVITIPEHHLKVSLRSPYMLPRYAIIDPELTYSLPPDVTAQTGLDALTQLIEPYVCSSPNPLTDALCREGISRIARSLLAAYKNGQTASAREDMSLASMFGGMALANARLGAVHGLASPIGGMIAAPHGAIVARLLPLVMEANLAALNKILPGSPVILRYAEVARLLTSDESAVPKDGVEWVWNICIEMKIHPLSDFGLITSHFPRIVAQAQNSSSMKGNPVTLTSGELTIILEKSI